MPRPRKRVRLESGPRLDLCELVRKRFIQPGCVTGPFAVRWHWSPEENAIGLITSDLTNPNEGWVRVKFGQLDQKINIVSRPRYFGGRQLYFLCPHLNRRASVLWKPAGAHYFTCRRDWGKQVAYSSQFETAVDRADRGMAKIKSKLSLIGGLDEAEAAKWDIPPKPRWMRLRTYGQAVQKYDEYESVANEQVLAVMTKFMRRAR